MRFALSFLFFASYSSLLGVSTINFDVAQVKKGEYHPWFTGPIIAGSGKTMAPGHFNIEPYFFTQESNGFYDKNWHKRHRSTSIGFTPLFFFVTGLNSFMDIQGALSLQSNFRQHQKDARCADSMLGIGFQLCNDNRYSFIPDMRLILKQDFATGHYKNLNPQKLGTDATGSGFYRSGVALNIQKLFYFQRRLLLARCNVNYKISLPTSVKGYSVFGGGPSTYGKISPVHFANIDLAFEYTLSQELVFAIDAYYEYQSKGPFKGQYVKETLGTKKPSSESLQRFSLAPALEYNFSAAFGIIAGVWFSIAGKNASSFTTGVIAFNYVR